MEASRYVRKSDTAGRWEVVKEGHRRATAHASTRDGAIKKAERAASREGGGEVRILNRTGKVVSSKSVSRAPRNGRR